MRNTSHIRSFPRRRESSRRAALNWVPAFAGMIAVSLVGCSPSDSKLTETELLKPTLRLEEPAAGSIQCYTDEDGEKSPSMAFSFNEKELRASYLMDESQEFDVEFNDASIALNFERHNTMDTDKCKWFFNRLTGDGGLYCMLAETDNFQQELEFRCQPFGKRKF